MRIDVRQAVPFGKYLLLDRISVGGMAEVFKAKSYGVEGFEKVIAIKRILPSMGEDRDFIKMFIDEAKIAGQLTHANICQIFELGRIDGAHFIAMEYIWGKDLLQVQNRLRKLKRPMPAATACFIVAKVCEGLDYAHRKRDPMGRPLEIVHRDCSPQNVLISYEGEVKLIDFGIAKAASRSSRTMAGVLKGKFGYMSPEQVRGLPLDRRSDIFALGTVLYESITGERLFQGETDFATLEKVRNVEITPPRRIDPSIPVDVEAVIMRALARDAEERYAWCSDMLADLQAILRRQDAMVTSKALSGWLKELFAAEIDRERQQLESYKRLGRDGLIAGVPAAAARLDVVEHLGPAGTAEDPTTLGGPSFDDVVDEHAPAGPALGSPAAVGRGTTDFQEEAPTSIFGEIVDADAVGARLDATAPAPAASVLVKHPTGQMPVVPSPGAPPRRHPTPPPVAPGAAALPPFPGPPPRPGNGPSVPPPGSAAAAKTLMGMSAPVLPPSGPPAPPPGRTTGSIPSLRPPPPPAPGAPPPSFAAPPPPGAPPASFAPPAQAPGFGSPASFAPPAGAEAPPARTTGPQHAQTLAGYYAQGSGAVPAYQSAPPSQPAYTGPAPDLSAPVPAVAPAPARPAVGKDVAIGIGIAAVVLSLVAVGRFVVFEDQPSPASAAAPATGSLVITTGDDRPADVFVDDERRGSAEGGRFEVAALDPGSHRVKVARDGAAPCEKTVEVAAREVASVRCELVVAAGAATAEPPAPTPAPVPAIVPAAPVDAGVDAADDDVIIHETDGADEPDEPAPSPAPARTAPPAPSPTAPPPPAPSPAQTATPTPRPVPRPVRPDAGAPPATAAPAAEAEPGFLVAFTTPIARVMIDGNDTGKSTPIAPARRLSLPPGKHTLTFVIGDEIETYTVTISSGKTTRFTRDLQIGRGQ
jgi:serine/threonine protein kinase